MLVFIIWTFVTGIFVMIGIGALKSEKEVGFFTFAEPPEVKNIKSYNKAVGCLWFIFAFILELLGIPVLFYKQNSPELLLVVFGVIALVIFTILAYLRIEKVHRA